jgi:hypothetical protein
MVQVVLAVVLVRKDPQVLQDQLDPQVQVVQVVVLELVPELSLKVHAKLITRCISV